MSRDVVLPAGEEFNMLDPKEKVLTDEKWVGSTPEHVLHRLASDLISITPG